MLRRLLPVVLPLVLLAACGRWPEAEDLYGTWTNVDAGQTRTFVFVPNSADPVLAGQADVFTLYSHPNEADPVAVMKGRFRCEDAPLTSTEGEEAYSLVQDVLEAEDAGLVGATFGNAILAWEEGVSLTLESTSSLTGERTYDFVGSPAE